MNEWAIPHAKTNPTLKNLSIQPIFIFKRMSLKWKDWANAIDEINSGEIVRICPKISRVSFSMISETVWNEHFLKQRGTEKATMLI